MGRRWTEEEINELKVRYPNESIGDIADRFGRSYQAIASKAHSLGLQRYPEIELKENLSAPNQCKAKEIFNVRGSVRGSDDRKYLRMYAKGRDLVDLLWFRDNVGGNIYTYPNWKGDWYMWTMNRQEDVERFLEIIDYEQID